MKKWPNLNKLVKKWQKRLGLTNWRISASYCGVEQMGNRDGSVSMTPESFLANIWIIVPDHRIGHPMMRPTELLLIHEMLHLWIESFMPEQDKDEVRYVNAEQAINKIADALYYKDYKK